MRRGSGIRIVHARVAGRARIYVATVHFSDEQARGIERSLAGAAGVRRASASSLTGTLLVIFDPRLDLEALLGTTPLTGGDWLAALVAGVAPLVANETLKLLR